MQDIKKDHLLIESLSFSDIHEGKEGAHKLKSLPAIAEVIKKKTALRHSKSFPKIDKFYMYNPELGIYIEFSNNELVVLLNKIFLYSNLVLPNLNLLESIAKILRLSPEALFGEPIYDNNYIVFKNCVYDLESNAVQNFSPEIFKISRLPYDYDPECSCGGFLKFLYEFCGGHQDRIDYIRAWMWAIVRTWNEGQVLLYILGPGSTGKSQLASIITALVGKEATITTTLKDLHTDRFEASNLRGKKLCIINDTEHYKGDMSLIKQIVGGDSIRGRLKNVNGSFEITPECLVMIVGNYPLGSRDTSGALSRRYRVFLADHVSEERTNLLTHQPSGQWSGKLAKELPGVICWVLEVNKVPELKRDAKSYLVNTDKMVPSLREINRESLEALNPITSWIRDEIEPGEGAFVGFTIKRDLKSDLEVKKRRTLYPTFRMWAERREITALSHRTFTSDLLVSLKKEGYKDVAKVRRTEGMYIEGIRIKDTAYDRDHVYGSTLYPQVESKSRALSPVDTGYKPPEKNQQHPALTSDLYGTYKGKLGKTEMKVYLNRKVKIYFSDKGPLIEEKLKSQYFQGMENPSEAYIESFLKVLRRGIQSIAKFGAIPYSYKQMGVSPRISPVSYGNTINNVKRLIREEAYSYLGELANREFKAKILDLDLKSCFTSIIIGLYPQELEVLQSAIENTGLWNHIKQEFIKEKREQWYSKGSVKICVYSSFFQGGGNAMIQGMMDQHQKDLGMTPKEFRELPEYERLYESSRNIAEVMQNSSIIMDFRKVSEEMKRAHMDDYLIGPTGHAYKVTDDSFRSAYSSFLQSFEFALLAEATLRVIRRNPKIEVIGHFHDGNVLLIPEGDLQETMSNLEDILKELGYSLGLSYRQTLEVKNQWPG